MHAFAITSFRSFLGTRGAFSGLLLSLLPAGAMCLGLSLQSNLAVELGLDDNEVAKLNAWSALISAVARLCWSTRRPSMAMCATTDLPVARISC
jgi:PAT family beta-lactamase induction signal transducer AmpG